MIDIEASKCYYIDNQSIYLIVYDVFQSLQSNSGGTL